jgi:hypothetical protein
MGIRKKVESAKEFNGPKRLPKSGEASPHYRSKRKKRKAR